MLWKPERPWIGFLGWDYGEVLVCWMSAFGKRSLGGFDVGGGARVFHTAMQRRRLWTRHMTGTVAVTAES